MQVYCALSVLPQTGPPWTKVEARANFTSNLQFQNSPVAGAQHVLSSVGQKEGTPTSHCSPQKLPSVTLSLSSCKHERAQRWQLWVSPSSHCSVYTFLTVRPIFAYFMPTFLCVYMLCPCVWASLCCCISVYIYVYAHACIIYMHVSHVCLYV